MNLPKAALLAAWAIGAPLAAASGAESFPALDMERARSLVTRMQALSRTISARPIPARLRLRQRDYVNDTGPINAGFTALGPAGQTGTIDGPGQRGNGAYRVVNNEPYRLQVIVATGFIAGEITLARDPASGRTTLRFAGQRWDVAAAAWMPPEDMTNDVVVEYRPQEDIGCIRWLKDGEWKHEQYWNGGSGRSMTIEFHGGWDHDFRQAGQ